ncbi:unnamed protein product [Ambrosiozyma monospora]|uniref:Unnamed protein product n=1 Tax=Ambrosiozyma monospora TaxID=43982 RepID=A0A9W7DIU2_AMBMO|nr:unnamed protein product [Ambrosiozyma monospora]
MKKKKKQDNKSKNMKKKKKQDNKSKNMKKKKKQDNKSKNMKKKKKQGNKSKNMKKKKKELTKKKEENSASKEEVKDLKPWLELEDKWERRDISDDNNLGGKQLLNDKISKEVIEFLSKQKELRLQFAALGKYYYYHMKNIALEEYMNGMFLTDFEFGPGKQTRNGELFEIIFKYHDMVEMYVGKNKRQLKINPFNKGQGFIVMRDNTCSVDVWFFSVSFIKINLEENKVSVFLKPYIYSNNFLPNECSSVYKVCPGSAIVTRCLGANDTSRSYTRIDYIPIESNISSTVDDKKKKRAKKKANDYFNNVDRGGNKDSRTTGGQTATPKPKKCFKKVYKPGHQRASWINKLLLGKYRSDKYIGSTDYPLIGEHLNESQKLAVDSALNQQFTLLKGPPGSGKTTTIHEMVLQLVAKGEFPILVVATSNLAVDNIAEKLMNGHKTNIVRVPAALEDYPPSHKLGPICLHNLIMDKLQEAEKKKYKIFIKGQFQFLTEDAYYELLNSTKALGGGILNNAQVVLTTSTCYGSIISSWC